MKILVSKKLTLSVVGVLVMVGITAVSFRLAHADTSTVTISITTSDQPASAADWHVTSSPAGIDCTGGSGTCSFDFTKGIDVKLTATPPSDRLVSYWQVPTDCHEPRGAEYQNSCTFTASQAQTIRLYWIYATYTVSVATKGTGSGTITSSIGGLSCPSTCTHTYGGQDVITLTATPAPGSTFAGWGAESEGGTTCWLSGKNGGTVRSYSSTCLFGAAIAYNTRTYTAAVAFFDKTATSSKPSSTTTSTTPPPPAATQAAAPTLSNIAIDGKTVSGQNNESVDVQNNKPVVLNGQTVPNGLVTLYIFSEPRTVTATADKDGKWSYAIFGLPTGSHHVEYTITDPATNVTSARAQLLAFTLTAAKKSPISSSLAAKPASHRGTWIILSIALVALLAGGGFTAWWIMRKKRTQKQV